VAGELNRDGFERRAFETAERPDQFATKPQFDGRNGTISTPRSRNSATRLASEPGRGQLAPPSARMVTSGRARTSSTPLAKRSAPPCRNAKRAPKSFKRRSHAHNSGDAFINCGNTRPLEPTKVGWPKRSHHARSVGGGNASIPRRNSCGASP
jgi:hypothetical protein